MRLLTLGPLTAVTLLSLDPLATPLLKKSAAVVGALVFVLALLLWGASCTARYTARLARTTRVDSWDTWSNRVLWFIPLARVMRSMVAYTRYGDPFAVERELQRTNPFTYPAGVCAYMLVLMLVLAKLDHNSRVATLQLIISVVYYAAPQGPRIVNMMWPSLAREACWWRNAVHDQIATDQDYATICSVQWPS